MAKWCLVARLTFANIPEYKRKTENIPIYSMQENGDLLA